MAPIFRRLEAFAPVMMDEKLLATEESMNSRDQTAGPGHHVASIQLLGRPRALDGYALGFRQPILRYALRILPGRPSLPAELGRLMAAELGTQSSPEADPGEWGIPKWLVHWTRAILEKAVHPVFEDGLPQAVGKEHPGHFLIAQPCLNHSAALRVVVFLIKTLNRVLAGDGVPVTTLVKEQVLSELRGLLKGLAPLGLQGFNTLHFLSAAHELGVPWTHLQGNVFQLGMGSKARWIESSFTDLTPVISVGLARNKLQTASVLRLVGLPVPPHYFARSEDEAVACAERLSYPVVVKPVDLDGGKGVKANLRNPPAVRKAFALASSLSKHVLVEKHVAGRDYRIQVVNGAVHGVLERVPGGVTGNGIDNMQLLLDMQNYERRIALDDRRFLHQMELDEEAEEELSAQGMNQDSVPASGQFVRLRGASNVASGGVPVPLPLETVHPDNLDLAIRATRALRLDVAGVDLLIPDIERSWLETGAHICEVNAQPQMFTTMHKPMLVDMLGDADGRIPVAIVIAGELTGEDLGFPLYRELLARNVCAGLVSGREVWIGSKRVTVSCPGSFTGAKILCHDLAVEAMIICIADDEVLNRGWPVDACDVLILDTRTPGATNPDRRYDPSIWIKVASTIAPKMIIVSDHDMDSVKFGLSLFRNVDGVHVLENESQESRTRIIDMAATRMIPTSR